MQPLLSNGSKRGRATPRSVAPPISMLHAVACGGLFHLRAVQCMPMLPLANPHAPSYAPCDVQASVCPSACAATAACLPSFCRAATPGTLLDIMCLLPVPVSPSSSLSMLPCLFPSLSLSILTFFLSRSPLIQVVGLVLFPREEGEKWIQGVCFIRFPDCKRHTH